VLLPVFLRLHGARAAVLGGNTGAAWKARLLASVGARVGRDRDQSFGDAPHAIPDGAVKIGYAVFWRVADHI
jgi:siroheme synthase (precorrin-2 oxidase/ferrochelatase)